MQVGARTLAALGLVLVLAGGPGAGGERAAAGEPEGARRAAAAAAAAEVRPGEVLVALRPGARAAAVARRASATAEGPIGTGLHRLRVPVGQERARARALGADPEVLAAAPNFVRRAQVVPDDALFDRQWALPRIGAPSGWDVTRGRVGVTIAVLDSGVDADHPDLAGKLLPGASFLGVDPAPPNQTSPCQADAVVRDEFDHGTHVTGIAAAATGNAIGVAGVAWQPRVLPVKVLDCTGNGTDSQVIAGMDWAVSQGARVINLSFGGPGQSDVLDAAVHRAWQAGALVVAAAGNAATDVPFYPAASPHALAVTATDQQDRFAATFSNHGRWVHLAAPGVAILSTYPTYKGQWHVEPGYQFKDGTSMAGPHVSGLAALLLSRHPDHSPNRLMALMFLSADKVVTCPVGVDPCEYDHYGRNNYLGHGRINVARAVRVANLAVVPLAPLRAPLGS